MPLESMSTRFTRSTSSDHQRQLSESSSAGGQGTLDGKKKSSVASESLVKSSEGSSAIEVQDSLVDLTRRFSSNDKKLETEEQRERDIGLIEKERE